MFEFSNLKYDLTKVLFVFVIIKNQHLSDEKKSEPCGVFTFAVINMQRGVFCPGVQNTGGRKCKYIH